jgi:choline dehydrogenase
LTMPPSTLGAFAKSRPSLASPDLEWHVQPLSLPKFGEPLHPFDAITPSVCNLRPSSRGSVHIQHPETLAAPKIQCNYLSTEGDIDASVRGLEMTRAIMRGHALARFEPQEFLPGPAVRANEELAQAARELGTTIFHPVGTCAMGTVLDSDCRLRGIAGLRVVDASAMPLITSGNTNAPVMLIAQRAAESIVRDNSAL